MSRSVLVVEDDAGIRLVLATFLGDEGYRVLEAETGEQALELFAADPADAVLVDLRLPGMHGLDVIRALRAASHVSIIVVTAQADSHDVVAGLEAGADDYVTKPFVAKELSARIRAQLRRASPAGESAGGPEEVVADPAAPVLVSGDLEVRPDTAEVFLAGRALQLSRTEFRVLLELMTARGRVLSRDELLRKVWGYSNPGDGRVVDNLVYRLRAKLEDDPTAPAHLLTVRGFGYRFRV